jgi:hypothetical protein
LKIVFPPVVLPSAIREAWRGAEKKQVDLLHASAGRRTFFTSGMETIMNPVCSPVMRLLTTEEFAHFIALRPQSIRKRYSQTGSYHGVRPLKLPNRRLMWPADAVDQLLRRGVQ